MVVSVGWWTKPLLRKWLFHQTSIKKWLFRVPGARVCVFFCSWVFCETCFETLAHDLNISYQLLGVVLGVFFLKILFDLQQICLICCIAWIPYLNGFGFAFFHFSYHNNRTKTYLVQNLLLKWHNFKICPIFGLSSQPIKGLCVWSFCQTNSLHQKTWGLEYEFPFMKALHLVLVLWSECTQSEYSNLA